MIGNDDKLKEFVKLAKEDPMLAAVFWHKGYLVAMAFLDEKGLRDEFNEYEKQFDIKLKG